MITYEHFSEQDEVVVEWVTTTFANTKTDNVIVGYGTPQSDEIMLLSDDRPISVEYVDGSTVVTCGLLPDMYLGTIFGQVAFGGGKAVNGMDVTLVQYKDDDQVVLAHTETKKVRSKNGQYVFAGALLKKGKYRIELEVDSHLDTNKNWRFIDDISQQTSCDITLHGYGSSRVVDFDLGVLIQDVEWEIDLEKRMIIFPDKLVDVTKNTDVVFTQLSSNPAVRFSVRGQTLGNLMKLHKGKRWTYKLIENGEKMEISLHHPGRIVQSCVLTLTNQCGITKIDDESADDESADGGVRWEYDYESYRDSRLNEWKKSTNDRVFVGNKSTL